MEGWNSYSPMDRLERGRELQVFVPETFPGHVPRERRLTESGSKGKYGQSDVLRKAQDDSAATASLWGISMARWSNDLMTGFRRALPVLFQEAEELQGAARVFLNLHFEDGGILVFHLVAKPVEKLDFHLGFVDLAGESNRKVSTVNR